MNQDITPTVRAWLEDTISSAPPPVNLDRAVAAEVQRTPQRHAWWRRLRAGSFLRDRSPITASDAQTPTAIGRTQTMLSPAKAITAGALVFAIGGVMLIAQTFDQQSGGVPGAAEDRAAPVEFTVQWAFGPPIRPATSEAVGNGTHERGGAWQPSVLTEASDPRWQGTISVAQNSDDYGAVGGPSVGMFAFRIENEEGVWQQTPTVTVVVPGVDEVDRGVFVGEGAYEGLIAVVDIVTDHAAQAWDLHGYIVDGELPPPPEPVIAE